MRFENLSFEEEWPLLQLRKDESLFGSGGPEFDARIARAGTSFANSYFETADEFVAAIESGAIQMRDWFALPLIHLYHHGLELLLKDVIEVAQDAGGKSLSPEERKRITHKDGHNIPELWKVARTLIEKIKISSPEHLDGVGDYLNQLEASVFMACRYGFDQNGNPVPFQVETVNLAAMADAVARVRFALDSDQEKLHQVIEAEANHEQLY